MVSERMVCVGSSPSHSVSFSPILSSLQWNGLSFPSGFVYCLGSPHFGNLPRLPSLQCFNILLSVEFDHDTLFLTWCKTFFSDFSEEYEFRQLFLLFNSSCLVVGSLSICLFCFVVVLGIELGAGRTEGGGILSFLSQDILCCLTVILLGWGLPPQKQIWNLGLEAWCVSIHKGHIGKAGNMI